MPWSFITPRACSNRSAASAFSSSPAARRCELAPLFKDERRLRKEEEEEEEEDIQTRWCTSKDEHLESENALTARDLQTHGSADLCGDLLSFASCRSRLPDRSRPSARCSHMPGTRPPCRSASDCACPRRTHHTISSRQLSFLRCVGLRPCLQLSLAQRCARLFLSHRWSRCSRSVFFL